MEDLLSWHCAPGLAVVLLGELPVSKQMSGHVSVRWIGHGDTHLGAHGFFPLQKRNHPESPPLFLLSKCLSPSFSTCGQRSRDGLGWRVDSTLTALTACTIPMQLPCQKQSRGHPSAEKAKMLPKANKLATVV